MPAEAGYESTGETEMKIEAYKCSNGIILESRREYLKTERRLELTKAARGFAPFTGSINSDLQVFKDFVIDQPQKVLEILQKWPDEEPGEDA